MSVIHDESFGIIPVHDATAARQYLLIQHQAGHWSFPKGHAEPGESARQAARRELAEETGLTDITLIEHASFIETYSFRKSGGKTVHKRVTYFLARTSTTDLQLQPEEVADALWADYPAARQRLTFDEGRALLDRVHQWLDAAGGPDPTNA